MPFVDFSDVTGAAAPERTRVDFADVTGRAAPKPRPVLLGWRDLKRITEGEGFTVTSTTGGGHNTGSAHYTGRAVDVRTRDKTPAEVERFMRRARETGAIVRDERVRPKGQKVWGGPHIHLQTGGATAKSAARQEPFKVDFSEVT